MRFITLQTRLANLTKTLKSFSKLNMKKQCLNTLFKLLKVEKQIEELETTNKRGKKMSTKTTKIKDSEVSWRSGDYGVRCTVNKKKLNINFSDAVTESSNAAAVVDYNSGSTYLKGFKLMTAVSCQIIDNVWVEKGVVETVERSIPNAAYVGGKWHYNCDKHTFVNQFGEMIEWVNDPHREDTALLHPAIKYAKAWRNHKGQPIDHQQWCDSVVTYLKANSPSIFCESCENMQEPDGSEFEMDLFFQKKGSYGFVLKVDGMAFDMSQVVNFQAQLGMREDVRFSSTITRKILNVEELSEALKLPVTKAIYSIESRGEFLTVDLRYNKTIEIRVLNCFYKQPQKA